jgi:hypothetical protein
MKRKETGVPASTPKSTRLLRVYLLSINLQPRDRRCLGCGAYVDNDNLAGHARKGAFAGNLLCEDCIL